MRTVDLWATDGFVSIPDGNSLYVWGFAGAPDVPAQLPGPTLVIDQGDEVVVNLTNRLAEPVSLRFPGQEEVMVLGDGGWEPARPQDAGGRRVSFMPAALPGQTITYRFVAARPGTYLYESGTDPHRQVPMGLYGAIVVHPADYDPATNRTAYGAGTGTEYDREYLMIFGEMDPEFHRAVRLGLPHDVKARRPRYWTLNGRCAPDTLAPDRVPQLPNQPYGTLIEMEPGERVLLRYAGAGVDGHPIHPHGNHTRLVALDGHLLRNGASDLSYKRFTVRAGAGETCDMIFEWTGLEFTPANPIPTVLPNLRNLVIGADGWTYWSGSAYLGHKGDLPVGVTSFNRIREHYIILHSHSEFQMTNWGEHPGGIMTFIAVYPAGTLGPDAGVLA
ncbi:multicopper oxidase [Limnochorda pilosa]|uniref:Multicopper oxidase n=1 Tax=Limnochorda pilosa TaxID=1555112 RepID=A0A0K2SIS4_LIMPI|nr:multicopper oxidase [Limnochorda pilosa]